jgi:hypothetical protein
MRLILILPDFAPFLAGLFNLYCLPLRLFLPTFSSFFLAILLCPGVYFGIQLATKQVLSCLAFCICLPPFAPCFLALICSLLRAFLPFIACLFCLFHCLLLVVLVYPAKYLFLTVHCSLPALQRLLLIKIIGIKIVFP